MRPGTRPKSRVLCVTTVAPSSSAMLAIRRSILPTFSLSLTRVSNRVSEASVWGKMMNDAHSSMAWQKRWEALARAA